MPSTIRAVEYFTTTATDQPGEGCKLLSALADLGVNLLAFTAVPTGTLTTLLTIFPADSGQFADAARRAGISAVGPHRALMVQGDDRLGALAEIHRKLGQADINVIASSGIADGRGSYGYVLYIHPRDFDRALEALAN